MRVLSDSLSLTTGGFSDTIDITKEVSHRITENDLKNGIIYVYSNSNFAHHVKLDLNTELAKGSHSYDIHKLLSSKVGYPPNLPLIISSIIISLMVYISCYLIWIKKIKSISKRTIAVIIIFTLLIALFTTFLKSSICPYFLIGTCHFDTPLFYKIASLVVLI